MIFIITFCMIQAMLPLFNLIEIHDQIEGFFKSYAMAQSACQGLVFLRNERSFSVILELFSLGTLSQFLAYLNIACINSNEIHEQKKSICKRHIHFLPLTHFLCFS